MTPRPAEAAQVHVGAWTSAVRGLLSDATVSMTGDVVRIDHGGAEGIVVLVSPRSVEIHLPTVEWRSPGEPVPSTVLWRVVGRPGDTIPLVEDLGTLLAKARRARRRQFRRCRYCGERVPPEHRIRVDCCHGCASTHEGVVF